jgi:hypothetical protein
MIALVEPNTLTATIPGEHPSCTCALGANEKAKERKYMLFWRKDKSNRR